MLKLSVVVGFSAACLAPAIVIWSSLAEGFGLNGAISSLAFIGVWTTTCGGLAAIATVFLPGVVREKSAWSLWLRVMAIAFLALVVGSASAPRQIMAVGEGLVWLVNHNEAAAAEVPSATTPTRTFKVEATSKDGLAYLFDLVEAAKGDLLALGVMSRARPEALVANTVDDELVVGLILTERLSHQEMFGKGADDKTRRGLLDAVLARIGDEHEMAFGHEKSEKGALGITQMTKDTYLGLAAAYPNALLDPDSVRGRSDHTNAVKAMILHLDEEAARTSAPAARRMRTAEWRHRALVAGYNTFSDRAYKAVEECGANWRMAECRVLPVETKRYVEMYLWVAEAI